MREILFRGKTSDGEWVEGFYLYTNENTQPVIIDMECCSNVIIPETVGQFTGLTDRNGVKMIFEGDICKFKRFNNIHVGEIVFNATTASFVMRYQSIVGVYGEKATHKILLSVCDNIEVIGNIHDSPELLR